MEFLRDGLSNNRIMAKKIIHLRRTDEQVDHIKLHLSIIRQQTLVLN